VNLPIEAVLDELWTAARSARGFVLVAPPGAGKTTRVPRRLADEPGIEGRILVVQPRRVAARSAAARLAAEDGTKLGARMGYAVRFDRRADANTRVVVMTEGILLRRLQADPFLSDVGAVLLDEFHERSLASDLALGLLAEVRREARPDLVVGVMSATLDPAPVADFLGGVPVVLSEGRTFPLTVHHVATDVGPATRPRELAAATADAIRHALGVGEGDVLAFLPSLRTVDETVAAVRGLGVEVLPLHGGLSPAEQDRALSPGRERRVVAATNLAETSVTVPGVRIVVDTGLARRPRFSSATGLDRLETVRISQASADQRAGRAGRTAAGHAIRLWSARSHDARPPFDPAEIHRVDLAGAALQLLAWGTPPSAFDWFEPPPAPILEAAEALLTDLGAAEGGRLTPLGRRMAELPLHPRLARRVLDGGTDARWAAAWLAEGGRGAPADLELAIRAVAADPPRAVRRGFDQIGRLAGPTAGRSLDRAVLAAWPDRVAQRRPHARERARLASGRGVRFDPDDVPPSDWTVALDVDDRGAEGFVRRWCAIDVADLPTEAVTATHLDPATGAVQTRTERRYRQLVISAHPEPLDPHAAAQLLAEVAERDPGAVIPDRDDFVELRNRIALAHRLDRDVPEPTDAFLAALVPALGFGLRSVAALRDAPWARALRDAMGHRTWQRVERLAPERITVPSGSSRRLRYPADGPPVLAVRMQELFGATDTPRVGEGRVPVLLHLLAPNGRPQQITDDLAGFWANTWPEIRRENRARYPKHAWPEDPLSARPEARPQRRRR